MKQFEVLETMTFQPGIVIGLSQRQATRRAHLLDKAGTPGEYLVMSEIQLKAGEVIQLDEAAITKSQASQLRPKVGRPKAA